MATKRRKMNPHRSLSGLITPRAVALGPATSILVSCALESGGNAVVFFDRLPKELVFEIFDRLPLSDVGSLALTSESFRQLVAEYILTARCLNRSLVPFSSEIPKRKNGFDITEVAGNRNLLQAMRGPPKLHPFAILCKRMTCLFNTRERIRYAFNAFARSLVRNGESDGIVTSSGDSDHALFDGNARKRSHAAVISDEIEIEEKVCGSNGWRVTANVFHFMTMLHTFVRGWDESEFPLLLKELDAKFKLTDKAQRFFKAAEAAREGDRGSSNNCDLASEMELRLFTRCLAWDLAGNDYGHRAAWLMAVVNYLGGDDLSRQAMLFVLMFGPPCQDNMGHHEDLPEALNDSQKLMLNELNNHADWGAFTESTADDFHEGKEMFYTLAQAVCSCLSASAKWKQETCYRLLEELFVTPRGWMAENVAGFLLFCSEALILHLFHTKLASGVRSQVRQVALHLVEMLVVSHKFDNDFTPERGIGKVFDAICNYHIFTTRKQLIQDIHSEMMDKVRTASADLNEEIFEVIDSAYNHIFNKAYCQVKPHKSTVQLKQMPPVTSEDAITTADVTSSPKEVDGSDTSDTEEMETEE